MATTDIWKSYCESTNKTAIYPQAGTQTEVELAYLALGLIGELGELGELRPCTFGDAYENYSLSELGDCLWYVARLSLYSQGSGYSAIIPMPRSHVHESSLEIIGHLANSSKKIIRDQCSIEKFVGYVQTVADHLATSFVHHMFFLRPKPDEFWSALDRYVLQPNISKLCSRLERGTIKGDGEFR